VLHCWELEGEAFVLLEEACFVVVVVRVQMLAEVRW